MVEEAVGLSKTSTVVVDKVVLKAVVGPFRTHRNRLGLVGCGIDAWCRKEGLLGKASDGGVDVHC